MPINFPNNPSLNQLYDYDNKTWEWNGVYWEVYSALTSYVSTSTFNNYTGVTQPLIYNSITGGTYSGGTLYLINNSGTTIQITGFTAGGLSGDYLPLSGGTVSGGTRFTSGLSADTISATTYLNLPVDVFVTGGTYTSGEITFRNITGGTFTVTGLPSGNVGGGGIVYYLNLSNSQTPYREFSPIPTTAAQQSSGVSISNGATATIAEFLTPVGYPNATLLPGGVWTFHLHSNKDNNNASFQIFAEIYKRTSGGTETLLFQTDAESVLSTSPAIEMQICDAYFSGTPLNVSDRILVKVRATNTSNQTHTITLFTEGSQHYSYATTTFAVLGLTCDTLSGCSVIQTIETELSNKYDNPTGTTAQYIRGDGSLTNFPSGIPSIGAHYIERSYLNPDTSPISVAYVRSVNKVYVANNTTGTIRIFNAETGQLVGGLNLAGATHIHYLTGVTTPELWAFATSTFTTIHRINITPIGTPESIVGTITGVTGFLVAGGQANDVLTISPTKVYVSSYSSNAASISIVNPQTNTVIGNVTNTGVGGAADNVGLCLNTNPSSLMNNVVVQGRHTGLGIVNVLTDNMTVTNALNAISNTARYVKYVPSRDIYIVPTTIPGAGLSQRILILQPASSTAFTEVHRIDQITSPVDVVVNETDGVFYVSHFVTTSSFVCITAFSLDTYQPLYQLQTQLVPSNRSKMAVDTTSREIFLVSGAAGNNTFYKIRY